VKQPATFGLGGIRYAFPSGRIEPYVLGGVGVAKVRRDVTFTVGGTDVTSSLAPLGVTLGSDLSGSETKMMLSFGGGVAWPAWKQLVLDLQFRYGRILTEDQGTNVARAGIGGGVRF
jgi:opacity protein-like surface antigen